jgi:hypothetical protein
MDLGSILPLTSSNQPARKADTLTPLREPIVCKMWHPVRLTTLWTYYKE